MKEDICSIPINDVFAPKDGCPFCRMRDMLELRMAEYVTGAAMMEPDVRVTTNEQGFCNRHFKMMLKVGSRLSMHLFSKVICLKFQKNLCQKLLKASLIKRFLLILISSHTSVLYVIV